MRIDDYVLARDSNNLEVDIGDTVKYSGYPYLYTVVDLVEQFGYMQVEIKPVLGGSSFLASEDDIELV
jgi:hypothetical protein